MAITPSRTRATVRTIPLTERRPTMTRHVPATLALVTAAFCLACSGGTKAPSTESAPPAAAAAPGSPQTPDAGGVIDTVQMFTDAVGNYYKPKDVTVHPGDVVRFTLASGVHNVSFPADSNPGKSGLPAAGDYLQLPGQAYDIKITFAPGTYYFQCDAHAALGMQGHITVTPR